MLHAEERAESLDVPVAVLAESYVHMHLNRLFRAEQRAHELVVYDFLSCWYKGRIAQRQMRGERSRSFSPSSP